MTSFGWPISLWPIRTRTITVNIIIIMTVLASTPRENNALFILRVCCSFVFCRFKCSSCLMLIKGWILKGWQCFYRFLKVILKVIPMILVLCGYCCSRDVDFSVLTELKFYKRPFSCVVSQNWEIFFWFSQEHLSDRGKGMRRKMTKMRMI